MLLIDPYAYKHLSFKDIKFLNAVVDAIVSEKDEIDIKLLIITTLALYKPGMNKHALKTHVYRELKLN